MGLISKTLTIGCTLGGLACASQLPEFAQQYRQRLAGAVEELRVVVADFDRDAQASGLSRATALEQMAGSSDSFSRDRGASMERSIDRFERLDKQQTQMDAAQPVSRPMFLFSTFDEKLLNGTWEIFEPAVPLNQSGALWGGLGALFAGMLARIPIGLTRLVSRRKKPLKVTKRGAQYEVIGGIRVERNGAQDRVEPDTATIGKNNALAVEKSVFPARKSLLDQVDLEERFIGEVNAKGHIIGQRSPQNRKS